MSEGSEVVNVADQQLGIFFDSIRPKILTSPQFAALGRTILLEHSVFGRANMDILEVAAEHSNELPALKEELLRNVEEEHGPDHVSALWGGLSEELGLPAHTHAPLPETKKVISDLTELSSSDSIGIICGASYALESAATPELTMLQEIAEKFSTETRGTGLPKGKLRRFFEVHLGGVEQEHKDGIGIFMKEGMVPASEAKQGCDLAIDSMKAWWTNMLARHGIK